MYDLFTGRVKPQEKETFGAFASLADPTLTKTEYQ